MRSKLRKRKLSASQTMALTEYAERRNPWENIHGLAQHGGFTCTIWSLQRQGLLTWGGRRRVAITAKGRKALKEGCYYAKVQT